MRLSSSLGRIPFIRVSIDSSKTSIGLEMTFIGTALLAVFENFFETIQTLILQVTITKRLKAKTKHPLDIFAVDLFTFRTN
jgi:hypothetical protein